MLFRAFLARQPYGFRVIAFSERIRQSLRCSELLGGYDFSRPRDDQPEGVPEDPWEHCGEYCAYACELLDGML